MTKRESLPDKSKFFSSKPIRKLLREALGKNAPSEIEAVTFALILALEAPTDAKGQECAEIAEYIAVNGGLTEDQVEKCKAVALLHTEVAV
jgi:HD-GYP domain-containing protein (c-di-GMP phosphodiesterase class II)